MLEKIFAEMASEYKSGVFESQQTYYFSLAETKKTVVCTSSDCQVSSGRTVQSADCVCKTSPEVFIKIWNDGYRPGMKDFLSGAIKSNNPGALQLFLQGFGKN